MRFVEIYLAFQQWKKLWKSVKNWQSYRHEFGVLLFWDTYKYELPTNLQNFTRKDLTEVKIFQKVLGEATFLKHPVLQ